VIFSSPRPEAVEVTPDHSHKVPDRPSRPGPAGSAAPATAEPGTKRPASWQTCWPRPGAACRSPRRAGQSSDTWPTRCRRWSSRSGGGRPWSRIARSRSGSSCPASVGSDLHGRRRAAPLRLDRLFQRAVPRRPRRPASTRSTRVGGTSCASRATGAGFSASPLV